MIATHRFFIHARCPLVPHLQWDYYTVIVETNFVIDVHAIEKFLDEEIRGERLEQEVIAELVKHKFPDTKVTLAGRHSQNSSTTVEA